VGRSLQVHEHHGTRDAVERVELRRAQQHPVREALDHQYRRDHGHRADADDRPARRGRRPQPFRLRPGPTRRTASRSASAPRATTRG
jgi:hypothetical protein